MTNNTIKNAAKFLEELKSILRGYSKITSGIRRRMKKLGFVLVEGKKHCKVYFGSDVSHPFVMAKTPSDHRAGLNVAMGLFNHCAALNYVAA